MIETNDISIVVISKLRDHQNRGKFHQADSTNFSISSSSKDLEAGTTQVVHQLRLRAPNAGGPGTIPGRETRSRMPQLRACMPQLKKKISHAAAKMKILHVAVKIPHAATKTPCDQIN